MEPLTLNYIAKFETCASEVAKLLAGMGKDSPDDTEVTLLQILDICGFLDALWILDWTECNPKLARHFSAWCEEQRSAAAGDATGYSIRAAARAAAGDAVWDTAKYAAWAAGYSTLTIARDAQAAQFRAMLTSGEYEVAA